jgi:hypothetical protein
MWIGCLDTATVPGLRPYPGGQLIGCRGYRRWR